MPLDLARQLAKALNVRSESAVRTIDQVLSAYVRQTPQDVTTLSPGNIDASQVVSGTLANARVAEANVTQHQGALTIVEAQISDLGPYIDDLGNQSTVGAAGAASALPATPTQYIQIGGGLVIPAYNAS